MAHKVAVKSSAVPDLWPKCLLGQCYSLWFLCLPGLARASSPSARLQALHTAYTLLKRIEASRVVLADEVGHRILMQLCGLYGEPVLAVRVLHEMKKSGILPNAVTYGYYNKAVLESKWLPCPRGVRMRWAKVRNVVLAVAQFRKAIKHPPHTVECSLPRAPSPGLSLHPPAPPDLGWAEPEPGDVPGLSAGQKPQRQLHPCGQCPLASGRGGARAGARQRGSARGLGPGGQRRVGAGREWQQPGRQVPGPADGLCQPQAWHAGTRGTVPTPALSAATPHLHHTGPGHIQGERGPGLGFSDEPLGHRQTDGL